jgi:hypothetical protein
MKSQTRVAFPVLLALLVCSAVLPLHAQRTMPTIRRYVPPPMPRTVPGSTPVQPRPATQHQTNSVPQHQTNTAPQHQLPATPQRQAPPSAVNCQSTTPKAEHPGLSFSRHCGALLHSVASFTVMLTNRG